MAKEKQKRVSQNPYRGESVVPDYTGVPNNLVPADEFAKRLRRGMVEVKPMGVQISKSPEHRGINNG